MKWNANLRCKQSEDTELKERFVRSGSLEMLAQPVPVQTPRKVFESGSPQRTGKTAPLSSAVRFRRCKVSKPHLLHRMFATARDLGSILPVQTLP